MRAISNIVFMLSVSTTVSAHTLPGGESVPAQIGHQFLSLHHAPLLALSIVGGVALTRGLFRYLDGSRG